MTFNLLSPTYLSDKLEPISLWLTIGFVGALVINLLVTLIMHKENMVKVAKSSVLSLLFYSLALGILLLVAEIVKKYDSAYLEENWVNKDIIKFVFIPVLVTLCLALLGGITLFIIAKKKPTAFKVVLYSLLGLIGVGLIVCVILISIFYSQNIVGDGYYTGEYGKLNSLALYVCAGILIALVVALAFIIGRKNKAPFNTKGIALAGVCVAISFALSYIKFEAVWLQGGSITLVSFLPICLYSYIYGMKKGLLVGLIYGMLQAIQDPFIVHPAQFLLDYPIAFSMITMSGLLTDLGVLENLPRLKFTLGAVLTGTFRYVAHVISGVFAFGAYAMDAETTNFLIFSAGYNSYVFVDIALVIVVGVILLSSKSFRKELDKLKPIVK